MRQRISCIAVVVAGAVTFAGCGGGDDPAAEPATPAATTAPRLKGVPVTMATLAGDWLQLGTVQQVRFTPKGKFAMDYNKSDLDHPSTAAGSYNLSEGRIMFTVEPAGLFCVQGDQWAWEARVHEGDLRVTWVEPGCGVDAGTRWTLTPINR